MDIIFNIKATITISDIHGVEEEIRQVRQDILDFGLPGAVQCGRIDSYSIDSVETVKDNESELVTMLRKELKEVKMQCGRNAISHMIEYNRAEYLLRQLKEIKQE